MNNKKNQSVQIERFVPKLNIGLTTQEFLWRKKAGYTNQVNQKYSKSYLNIFVNNICTFFNLLGLIVFIALLSIGSSLSNFFFVFFYIANTTIGIVQELRAKACIDKLTILSSAKTKVVRNGEIVEINTNEMTISDATGDNSEVITIENGSAVDGTYTMGINLIDLKSVLDSCKNEHITMNCGNHKSVIINRGPISNVVAEARIVK